MKLLVRGLLAAALSMPCWAQSNRLPIRFQPESDRFAEAAHQYEVLWAHEGARITGAMEAASGLKFEDREVKAIVLEAAPGTRKGQCAFVPAIRPTRRRQN